MITDKMSNRLLVYSIVSSSQHRYMRRKKTISCVLQLHHGGAL